MAASPPCPPSPPDLDGYLSKLKHKQSLFGSWNKRYFKVNIETNELEYYKQKPAGSGSGEVPSGLIDLSSLHAKKITISLILSDHNYYFHLQNLTKF